ncbi:hypothetical protein F4678DRAFT_441024, partial [Xylaria arbuscula]
MDHQSLQRIVKSKGPNHPFSRRAGLAVRNGMNESDRGGGNSSQQPAAREEKGEAKADNGQSKSGNKHKS